MFKKLFKTEVIVNNKISDLSTEDLERQLLSRYNLDFKFDKDGEDKLFDELKEVDGLHEYLSSILNQDISRHFAAQDKSQQDLIRGAFVRTLYLKNRLKAKKKLTKKDNKRYK
jgi:hypothetical protein